MNIENELKTIESSAKRAIYNLSANNAGGEAIEAAHIDFLRILIETRRIRVKDNARSIRQQGPEATHVKYLRSLLEVNEKHINRLQKMQKLHDIEFHMQ